MYYVVDEFLNGLREDESGVGSMSFVWNEATQAYDPLGTSDVDVVSAPLADTGSKMLAWVDILSLRNGLDVQTRNDANDLIEFFNSEKFSIELLIPSYGSAPRYLLPARNSIYTNRSLLQAAPLYSRFFEIMKTSVSLTGPNLNGNLREIGKGIQRVGLSPQ